MITPRKQHFRDSTSALLQYLRFKNSFSQEKMAKILESSRSSYLRLENGERDLGYQEWSLLAEEFDVSTDDMDLGYFFLGQDDNEVFNLPDCYFEDKHTKGRLLSLFITFFKENLGQKTFNDFCKVEGIPPTYFTNLDNSINIRFTLRIFEALVMKNVIKSKADFLKLTQMSLKLRPQHGDSLLKEYERVNGFKRLETLLKNTKSLEENHDYIIEHIKSDYSEIVVSFAPKEHVDDKLYRQNIILNEFMREWIGSYFEYFSEVPVIAENIGNYFKGDDRNIYRYKLIQ